jgi:hypothetical protein
MSPNRPNDDLDALAERLRHLPPPPVPAGLEAKLLAAIPPAGSVRPAAGARRRTGLLVLAGALAAAAVLFAVLRGHFFGEPGGAPDGLRPQPAPQVAAFDPPGRVNSDPARVPASFEWPVQLTVPVTARRLSEELTD